MEMGQIRTDMVLQEEEHSVDCYSFPSIIKASDFDTTQLLENPLERGESFAGYLDRRRW